MRLLLNRLYDSGTDTIGVMFYRDKFREIKYIYTLEDEYRLSKIRGETRIPEGFYEITLRTHGRFYERYSKSSIEAIRYFTQKHGVLELNSVPNFDSILIHCGNTHLDTAGCLLVGDTVNNNSETEGFISYSMNAYARLVEAVGYWLDAGETYLIEIRDFDKEVGRII
jgi:hypothetical protein